MSDSPRTVYTVMAGCGVGEFLWAKKSTDSCLVGGLVFSRMDSAEDQDLISHELFNKLRDWAGQYMEGQPVDWALPWEIDWNSFNFRGVELTRMLKNELGASADVQYVRPDQDPEPKRLILVLSD